jgi:hypothetical protein
VIPEGGEAVGDKTNSAQLKPEELMSFNRLLKRRMTMKRTITSIVFFCFASLLSLGLISRPGVEQGGAGLVPTAQAQDPDRGGCSNHTLRGEYLFTGTAENPSDAPQATFPRRFVGVYAFDGAGNLSSFRTVSRGGVIDRAPATGIYQVNPDCTGTVTVEGSNWDMYITSDGKEGELIRTDPGSIATRSFRER